MLSGFDGACDIDVDVAGGLWIAEGQWVDRQVHLLPEWLDGDDGRATERTLCQLCVEVTSSASREESLCAVITAEKCQIDS